ncbi:hypothetical protein HN371_00245 [Candidatus Poribacteria bacterium]|nr:hypothetical protein [Candidatus Poribacteria bacterium]MBT7096606.1 hypothetical protein [Candidatus Poribacteria bacterium]
MPPKTRRFHVMLTDDLFDHLKRRADERLTSMAQFVRDLVLRDLVRNPPRESDDEKEAR